MGEGQGALSKVIAVRPVIRVSQEVTALPEHKQLALLRYLLGKFGHPGAKALLPWDNVGDQEVDRGYEGLLLVEPGRPSAETTFGVALMFRKITVTLAHEIAALLEPDPAWEVLARVAATLYAERKISFGATARIAGVPYVDFFSVLSR
jgi:hypothetical protein